MPSKDKRATEGQRFGLRISVVLPGKKTPENVLLSRALYDALERAARLEDRPMSNLLRLMAIHDVEGRDLFDREKNPEALSQAVHKATKLDDRTMSNYFRALATRYLTDKGLYDPMTALFDNELEQNGKDDTDKKKK